MTMQYRRLGRTALTVSELCLSTMNFGPHTSEPDSHAILGAAIDIGINFIDTANQYGGDCGAGATETILGNWLAGNPARRERIVLAIKVHEPMSVDVNDRDLSAPRPWTRYGKRSIGWLLKATRGSMWSSRDVALRPKLTPGEHPRVAKWVGFGQRPPHCVAPHRRPWPGVGSVASFPPGCWASDKSIPMPGSCLIDPGRTCSPQARRRHCCFTENAAAVTWSVRMPPEQPPGSIQGSACGPSRMPATTFGARTWRTLSQR